LCENLREIIKQIAELSTGIHRMSHDLHPSKLAHLGLVAALRSLCVELSERYGLKIEFTHSDVPANLPKDISLCLYRIVQESLNNVVRHSGAREAQVELRGAEQEIGLRISDSGSGFDVESARSKKGLGLISMRERLRLIGGTISIDSQISKGTKIVARVPLEHKVVSQEALLQYDRGRVIAGG
jgi:signal transduction histidine kinase